MSSVLTTLATIVLLACARLRSGPKAPRRQRNRRTPCGRNAGQGNCAACLECHEARIILQQRLSKAAWTKEVDKMTKWGATYDPSDREALIDYLSANFAPEKEPYEAPRTVSGKSHTATKH
jgi:hypothetical protein